MEVIGTDFENWGPYLMKQFQLMYERGEKCDLEISCNKQIFLVHRLIMSACSEYVKELGDKQHIILPEEVSCKALKMVLDFVYSGKIVFNKEEKDDLLLASNLLNMRLLTELIKMEESCSFTLSMDDETDEKPNENSNTMNESQEIVDNEGPELPSAPQTTSQINYKRRSSEMKSSRARSNKNSSVLPPLHKFPYLQQKFSASRTYGLITTLTDPVPSRFEIPETMKIECTYRSSFEDVSYETESLCSESESFPVLEQCHIQFLKKNRESLNHKRSYSNALYSPFDKYTPPYTVNNDNASRKRDASSSYLSRPEPIPPKRSAPSIKTPEVPKYVNKNIKTAPPLPPKVVPERTPVIENPCIPTDAGIVLQMSSAASENKIPEKDPEIIEVPSIENGEKVELIKLNNAVVAPVEDDFKVRAISEEVPDISISVIASENGLEKIEMKEDLNSAVPESTSLSNLNVVSIPEVNAATSDLNTLQPCLESSGVNSFAPDESACILPEDPDPGDTNESILPDPLPPFEDSHASFSQSLDDTITQVNATVNDIATDSSTQQIFAAVKAKGNENPAQLSKLVEDLCKKSPLLKNKNFRFKIVPVKGPIPDILKDQARTNSSLLNKAIIVKKTDIVQKPESVKEPENKPAKKTESKPPPLDNLTGPWECKNCGVGENPMKFDSYFDYRTHLHNVHSEPNNPVHCIYCGYKSLKRNMQLYHLFTKHNVEPPSNFKFPKCDKCEFYALNEYYLQKHLACHPSGGMEYVCSCKVAFKTSEALQKHITSGDCKNSKSFTCGYCRCMFDRFVNLKAHMRVCMKERSKPILQNNDNITPENTAKTISEDGKDYLAL